MSGQQLPSPPPPPPPPRHARKLESTPDGNTIISLPLQRIVRSNDSSSNSSGDYHAYDRSHRKRRLDGERMALRSSLGTHYVYADVGNPPHKVSLIVDTGSFTMAFPCVGCDRCRVGHQEDFWNPKNSATVAFPGCDDCHGTYR